jgi:nucleoside-diphosphate kinase
LTKREFSFLKPDAISRGLVGKVISRFEEAGFKIVKVRKGMISSELAELLYPNSKEQLTGMGGNTIKSTIARGEGERELRERYGSTDPYEIGKLVNSWNRKYATSTEVIAMVVEGEDAPTKVRELIGSTDPAAAKKGTVRGDYGEDSIYAANTEKRACRNMVHASDEQRAPVEIELFEEHFF